MVTNLTTRLPSHLIKWIDKLVGEGIYKSRSEAIRDFLRDYVLEVSEKKGR